ncbi:MAG TPA: hypothetical protein VGO48_10625 [Conexibacter sp.]|jgi:hypothetical protein|nr:hypothetical protein [Conexibacter sp.]
MRARLFAVALVATVALATAVGAASAGRFSLSDQTFRAVWAPISFTTGGVTVTCNLTLEGSYHSRTFAKVINALIGYVTRVRVARPCTNGTLWAYNGSEVNEALGGTLANSLPWHITYKAFAGRLPSINQMRILLMGVRFLARIGGVLCNFASTGEGMDLLINMTIGRVTSVSAEPTPSLAQEGGLCFEVGRFSGNGSYTVLNTTTGITVTLI